MPLLASELPTGYWGVKPSRATYGYFRYGGALFPINNKNHINDAPDKSSYGIPDATRQAIHPFLHKTSTAFAAAGAVGDVGTIACGLFSLECAGPLIPTLTIIGVAGGALDLLDMTVSTKEWSWKDAFIDVAAGPTLGLSKTIEISARGVASAEEAERAARLAGGSSGIAADGTAFVTGALDWDK